MTMGTCRKQYKEHAGRKLAGDWAKSLEVPFCQKECKMGVECGAVRGVSNKKNIAEHWTKEGLRWGGFASPPSSLQSQCSHDCVTV